METPLNTKVVIFPTFKPVFIRFTMSRIGKATAWNAGVCDKVVDLTKVKNSIISLL